FEQHLPRLFDTTPQTRILAMLAATRPNKVQLIGMGPFINAIAYGASAKVKQMAILQPDLSQARVGFDAYNGPAVFTSPGDEVGAWNAALVAQVRNHPDLAVWLVEHGAPIDRQGLNPESQVILATQKHNWVLLDLLLKRGASILETDATGSSALHVATYTDDVEAVQQLLRRGADINAPDSIGATPLRSAIGQRSPKVEQLLRDKGALEKLPKSVAPSPADQK
ncbi:ankyrin repeat domain-containing protein, partial [bacterium]